MAVKDYIRERFFPHIWCPGCGHGDRAQRSRARDREYGAEKERHRDGVGDRLFVADRRVPGFSHAAHHPRPGAGLRHRREAEPSGADAAGADGRRRRPVDRRQPLHPCRRRNIDMTAIVMNNRIYGMTGGQFSPLSGYGHQGHDRAVYEHRPGIRRGRHGDGRRGHLCGAHHGLPRPADGRDPGGGDPPQGIFGGGGDVAVPDLLRAEEQEATRWT